MTYKSQCKLPKTFYGVTFKPNDIKEVPGYINDPQFVRVDPTKVTTTKTNSVAEKPTAKAAAPVERTEGADVAAEKPANRSK